MHIYDKDIGFGCFDLTGGGAGPAREPPAGAERRRGRPTWPAPDIPGTRGSHGADSRAVAVVLQHDRRRPVCTDDCLDFSEGTEGVAAFLRVSLPSLRVSCALYTMYTFIHNIRAIYACMYAFIYLNVHMQQQTQRPMKVGASPYTQTGLQARGLAEVIVIGRNEGARQPPDGGGPRPGSHLSLLRCSCPYGVPPGSLLHRDVCALCN